MIYGIYLGIRVKRFQACGGGFYLWHAYRFSRVDDLAVEVGGGGDVCVDKQDAPNTGPGKVEQCRRAEPAGPDHADAGAADTGLRLGADE